MRVQQRDNERTAHDLAQSYSHSHPAHSLKRYHGMSYMNVKDIFCIKSNPVKQSGTARLVRPNICHNHNRNSMFKLQIPTEI